LIYKVYTDLISLRLLKEYNKKMVKRLKHLVTHSFVIFAVVGFLGTIANLSIFFIFVDVLKLWPNAIAVSAFLLVGVQNYALHHIWTFRKLTCGEKMTFIGWLRFTLTTLLGLGINLVVLNIILYFFAVPYKVIAQFCGVAFGTVFNYLGSRHFVFNKGRFAANSKSIIASPEKVAPPYKKACKDCFVVPPLLSRDSKTRGDSSQ
jgi:putative flippase GtrA